VGHYLIDVLAAQEVDVDREVVWPDIHLRMVGSGYFECAEAVLWRSLEQIGRSFSLYD